MSYVIFGRKVSTTSVAFADIQLPNLAMEPSVGFRILRAAGGDNSGYRVSEAGDVNGDGVGDIIVSAIIADHPNLAGNNNAGMAYIIFGRNMTGSLMTFGDVELSTIVSGSIHGFRIIGSAANDLLGSSVSCAGDINGDGVSDVWLEHALQIR